MIRKFMIHGLIWLVVITFGIQLVTGWFSKPKRVAGSSNISENDNPFKKSNSSRNDSENKEGSVKNNEPTTPVDPDAVISKGMLDNSLVEIEKVIGNGSELIVTGKITNQGTDGYFTVCGDHCQTGDSTRIYDDFGNKVTCSFMQLGNQSNPTAVETKMITGIAVPIKMKFNVPTMGGQTQAHKVAVLELWATGAGRYKCEFRNLRIEKIGSQPTPTPTPTPTPIASSTPLPSPTPTPTATTTGKTDK